MRMRRRARHLVVLVAAFLLATGVAATIAAPPASAHAGLVATNPSNGVQLDRAPSEVRLRFTEQVSPAPNGVTLRRADGTVVPTEPAVVAPEDPTTVVLPLPPDLPDGGYVVVFRVVSADSHPIAGAVAFGVGVAAVPVRQEDFVTGDPVGAAVFAAGRWVSYAGLALLAGVLMMFVICWPQGWEHRRARRILTAGWLASAAGGVAVLLLQGPYAAGRPLSAATDPVLLSATLDSDYGRYVLVRLGLVAASAVLVFAPHRLPARVRQAGAVLVGLGLPVTWVGTGHTNASGDPLAVVADVAHLVAMTSWFGGLLLLATCVLPRSSTLSRAQVTPLLRRFSMLATGAVAVLVVTGVYVAWRRVGTFAALLGTTYGRLLAFKLAIMGILLWFGALSRSVVQRRYATAEPEPVAGEPVPVGRTRRKAARLAEETERSARAQLHQSVRLEVGTAVAVLAVASVLVATPPGVLARAAEAAPKPVLAEEVVTGEGVVQVLVDPAWVGENRLVIELAEEPPDIDLDDPASNPLDLPVVGEPWEVEEVRAWLELPGSDLGTLPVELTETRTGSYEATAPIPAPGEWQLTVAVRTSEVDNHLVRFAVPVR